MKNYPNGKPEIVNHSCRNKKCPNECNKEGWFAIQNQNDPIRLTVECHGVYFKG